MTDYQIQGFYSGEWETVTHEETPEAARAMLQDYMRNERGVAFRVRPQLPVTDWTDRDVVDAIATYLGTTEEWSGADALEVIADLIGRVRPHPGSDVAEFRAVWPARTGRELPAAYDQREN